MKLLQKIYYTLRYRKNLNEFNTLDYLAILIILWVAFIVFILNYATEIDNYQINATQSHAGIGKESTFKGAGRVKNEKTVLSMRNDKIIAPARLKLICVINCD